MNMVQNTLEFQFLKSVGNVYVATLLKDFHVKYIL